ncbi:unnamed protein product [Caretta caretta]
MPRKKEVILKRDAEKESYGLLCMSHGEEPVPWIRHTKDSQPLPLDSPVHSLQPGFQAGMCIKIKEVGFPGFVLLYEKSQCQDLNKDSQGQGENLWPGVAKKFESVPGQGRYQGSKSKSGFRVQVRRVQIKPRVHKHRTGTVLAATEDCCLDTS